MVGLRLFIVILITTSLCSKMKRVCIGDKGEGEQNLDPRLIASRRCSLTFVAPSWDVASSCPVLVIRIHQLQCPTSLMKEIRFDADHRLKK